MMLGVEVPMTLSRKQIIDIKEKPSLHRIDVGNAIATYIGTSEELAYGLFSVRPERSFWVRYTPVEGKKVAEQYTVVLGKLEVEYEDQKYILNVGDTLDASKHSELLSFYAEDETEVLIEMTAYMSQFHKSYF
jgi:hypothetical protein